MDYARFRQLQSAELNIYEQELRVVYYARVSTDSDEQLNSLANQSKYYRELIDSNPHWHFAGGYVDEGISGTSVQHRESFLRMISDAKSGLFDLIITKEISRFSRNTLDSITYTRELMKYGVGVFFQSDNINTLSPDAELRLTIMASIAQDEVRKLSQRVRFGFRRAIENSVVLGADTLIGYEKKDGRLCIRENEAAVVRRIFETYAEGRIGLKRLSRELAKEGILAPGGKPYAYGTLCGMIKNPKYKGCYAGGKYMSADYRYSKIIRIPESEWRVENDGSVPAIVSPELWERANALLSSRGQNVKVHGKCTQNRYEFSGRIVCGDCGASFHRELMKNRSGERECYRCAGAGAASGAACGERKCRIYTDELFEILRLVYSDIGVNRERIISELIALYSQQHQYRLPDVSGRIAAVRRKKDKLLELCADGHITNREFREKNALLSEELEKLEAEKRAAEAEAAAVSEREKHLRAIEAEIRRIAGSTDFTREYSAALLERVKIYPCPEEKKHMRLVIVLRCTDVGIQYTRKTGREIHISQAQVSRLEKGALDKIKKQL